MRWAKQLHNAMHRSQSNKVPRRVEAGVKSVCFQTYKSVCFFWLFHPNETQLHLAWSNRFHGDGTYVVPQGLVFRSFMFLAHWFAHLSLIVLPNRLYIDDIDIFLTHTGSHRMDLSILGWLFNLGIFPNCTSVWTRHSCSSDLRGQSLFSAASALSKTMQHQPNLPKA